MVVQLNSEQEDALTIFENSNDQFALIKNLTDTFSEKNGPEAQNLIDVFSELVELGLIKNFDACKFAALGWSIKTDGLTSNGRTYREELKKLHEEERSNRIHEYLVASYGFIGGALCGGITAYVLHVLNVT